MINHNTPTDLTYGPVTLGDHLASEVEHLQTAMRGMLQAETVLTSEQFEAIAALGAAAHAMMQASEVLEREKDYTAVLTPEEDELNELLLPASYALALRAAPEIQPEPEVEQVVGIEIPAELRLTDAEIEMYAKAMMRIVPGEWFRASDLGLEQIAAKYFGDLPRQRGAISRFLNKLYDANILATKGNRGGRRLMLPIEDDQLESASSEPANIVERSEFFSHIPERDRDTPPSEVVPEPLLTPAERLRSAEAMRFCGELVTGITAMIEVVSDAAPTKSRITRQIANALEIHPQEASGLLKSLIADGHFHIVRTKEMSTVLVGPKPERAVEPIDEGNEATNALELSKEDPRAWTERDLQYAAGIFAILLEHTHVQQGTQPKEFIRRMGVVQDDITEFRQCLRKLRQEGYLEFNPRANINTRSEHSKRMLLPVYMIKDQQMKLRLKNDYEGVMAELQKLVDRDQAESSS